MLDNDNRFYLPPYTAQSVITPMSEVFDWSIKFLGIEDLWRQIAGEGLKIAVLDTGCDLSHPDLQGQILDAKDFTGSLFGPSDRQGHGTWCASMIAAAANDIGIRGIAYKSKLLIYKVLGDNGSGDERSIAAGVQQAMIDGADIISMSLGGPRMSESLRRLMGEFVSRPHKFIFAAAGNDGERGAMDTIGYPAKWLECLSVAAVDKQGKRAKFSSMGSRIDIAAPGVDMLGAVPGGYATMSGTSMATPCAAAVGALVLAKYLKVGDKKSPLDTVPQMREHLRKTAVPKGPNNEYGPGLINPADLLKDLGNGESPETPGAYKPIKLGPFGVSLEELHGRRGLFLTVGSAAAAVKALRAALEPAA